MVAPVLGRTLVVLAGAAAALTTCFWLAEVLVVLLAEVLVVLLEEEALEEVGTEDLVVNQGTTVVNFNVLKSVPAGYELCEVGDFYVGNGSAKVMVRKTKSNNGSSSSSASSSSNTTNTSVPTSLSVASST